MKNVLITGGCGFIGSNFVKILLETDTGYYPIILDSLTYAGNKNNLDNLHNDNYVFIKGDICDEALVKSLFAKYHFEGVFHFAAESHVDRSIDEKCFNYWWLWIYWFKLYKTFVRRWLRLLPHYP